MTLPTCLQTLFFGGSGFRIQYILKSQDDWEVKKLFSNFFLKFVVLSLLRDLEPINTCRSTLEVSQWLGQGASKHDFRGTFPLRIVSALGRYLKYATNVSKTFWGHYCYYRALSKSKFYNEKAESKIFLRHWKWNFEKKCSKWVIFSDLRKSHQKNFWSKIFKSPKSVSKSLGNR